MPQNDKDDRHEWVILLFVEQLFCDVVIVVIWYGCGENANERIQKDLPGLRPGPWRGVITQYYVFIVPSYCWTILRRLVWPFVNIRDFITRSLIRL